jgi:hypothetical protein
MTLFSEAGLLADEVKPFLTKREAETALAAARLFSRRLRILAPQPPYSAEAETLSH